jgi:hypothetical protein
MLETSPRTPPQHGKAQVMQCELTLNDSQQSIIPPGRMRVLVTCKRGNVAPRDKTGHCLCADCKAYNYTRQKRARDPDYQRQWRKNNREKVKSHATKWLNNNKEKRRQVVAAWRAANPDKVAAMSARAGAKWAKRNSGKRNALTRKRVAAKLLRTPKWADLKRIEAVYVEAAAISKSSGIPHEVDHIIPLQGRIASGLHVLENLQILPRSANRSKQNSFPEAL